MRNRYHYLASGQRVWIDETGLATLSPEDDDGPEYQGCECEIDWNCGCGRYGGYTWIETRYDGLEDAEHDRRMEQGWVW